MANLDEYMTKSNLKRPQDFLQQNYTIIANLCQLFAGVYATILIKLSIYLLEFLIIQPTFSKKIGLKNRKTACPFN